MTKIALRKLVLLLGDVALLYVSLGLTLFFRYRLPLFPASPINDIWELHKWPFFLVYALWIVIFYSAGMYDWERFTARRIRAPQVVLRPLIVGTTLAVLLFYFIPAFTITPKTNLLIDSAIAFVLLSLWRLIFIGVSSRASKINILFLGSTAETQKFSKYIYLNPSLGYNTVNAIHIGQFDRGNIKNAIKESNIDIVVIEPSVLANQELVKAFYEILPMGVSVISFPAFYESVTGKIPVSIINETWFLENLLEINKRTFETAKRILDIMVATLLIIPASIILPFVAIAIVVDSRGPVFYYQKRVGKGGGPFYFIKFRSMIEGADAFVGKKGNGDDSRHTRVGKFLRKTYLDELPQIINVLRGEMSFVGPRPERPEYVEELKKQIPFYEIRLLVKPGITGLAQINMANDASVEDAPEKLQYDLFYIKNRSIVTDLAIMLKTATILARRTGR